MGLFKKAQLQPPALQREDLANVMASAPRKEMEYIRFAEEELRYLESVLPVDEQILAAASCDVISLYASGKNGAIVVTPRRIVAVLGDHGKYKSDSMIGEPTMHVFPLTDLAVREGLMTSTGQPYSVFTLTGQPGVELQVAHDDDWRRSFFDAVRRQSNKEKLV